MPGTPGTRTNPPGTGGSKTKSETIGDGKGGVSKPSAAENKESIRELKNQQESDKPSATIRYNTPGNKDSLGNSKEVLRYPAKPALRVDKNTDYVLFDFYKYAPPFRDTTQELYKGKNALEQYNAIDAKYEPSTLQKQVMLYMPEDISTGHKANWQGKNFSNIGANIISAAGAANVASTITGYAGAIDEAASNFIPIAGAQVVTAALGKITGESVSVDEFIGSTRGVILNPNAELLFSGIDMRNFTLNYKLVPRNEYEAITVENIIRLFKKAMLPYGDSDYQDPLGTLAADILTFGFNPNGGGSIEGSYIRVPDVCRVQFMRGNGLNPSVPQYKMCAITGVDVSYTPDGVYAVTEGGRMVAYQLSLSFQETKLVFREDINYADKGASY